MKLIHSYVKDNEGLRPVTVELTLWPGLPNIQFMGMPDQMIRESALRIKSAIKAQGFEFPKTHQILVNLRPSYFKKTSQGLELAIAVAYLLETQQIPGIEEFLKSDFSVYGELTLGGQVQAPDDYARVCSHYFSKGRSPNPKLLMGGEPRPGTPVPERPHEIRMLRELSELRADLPSWGTSTPLKWERPSLNGDHLWSETEAKLLSVMAAGAHSALLAGPAGAGKTTLATALHRLMPEPTSLPIFAQLGESGAPLWRPYVRPHHSTPLRAMIGGGVPPRPGELTRAQGGLFLLDEFLEFQSVVLESLRQPMEDHVVRIARGGVARDLPCDTQFLATTNLCPCGQWTPQQPKPFCRFALKKCRSYAERFSGPLLDRFEIAYILNRKQKDHRVFAESEILIRIEKAGEYRMKSRGQNEPNAKVPLRDLETTMDPFLRKEMMPQTWTSLRREKACLRVARTLADLDSSEKIELSHIKQALEWTHSNFSKLSQWD